MTKTLHADGPWYDDSVTKVAVASFLNDIRSWMPDMVDGAGGGTWAPAASIIIGGDGLAIGAHAPLLFIVGAFLALAPGSDIADVDNQTIDPADGVIQEFAAPGGARNHDLVAAGTAGRILILKQKPAAGAAIQVRRSGFTGAYICDLTSPFGAAVLYDDGADWRLLITAGAVAAGTLA